MAMGSIDSMTYTYHHIRCDDALLPALAQKYAAMRMHAFQQSPSSFSYTLESELALSTDENIARLRAHDRHLVVTVAQQAGANGNDRPPLHECEWVAFATLFGPRTWDEHTLTFRVALEAQQQLSDEEIAQTTLAGSGKSNGDDEQRPNATAFWHMTGLFVDQHHRRRGLAVQLCHFAFDAVVAVESSRSSNQDAELRIFVDPANAALVRMYEQRLQFVRLSGDGSGDGRGRGAPYVALGEGTIANGEGASLPNDYRHSVKYTKRFALAMVRTIAGKTVLPQ